MRHFEVFSGGDGQGSEMMWEALSVAQHHDGVSGTAKQAVTFDYAQRISVGAAVADTFLESAIARIVSTTGQADTNFSYCPLANVSVCQATNNADMLAAVIYNPQARALSVDNFVGALVRIPVYSRSYRVYDSNRTLIPNQQVVPVLPTPAQPSDAATYEVVINTDVAGLGIQTVFLQRGNGDDEQAEAERVVAPPPTNDAIIENDFYVITFSNTTGLISSIKTKLDNVERPFVQDFAYYPSYQEDNQQDSGAYIFRPAMQASVPLTTSANPARILGVINGPVVQQVWQQVSDWVVQKITLYQGQPAIEFEWTVGPVPVDDGQGKEVIIRFNSSIDSDATWYTDSNGREFQKRVRNFRPTWKWVPTQPIAGNYCQPTQQSHHTRSCWLSSPMHRPRTHVCDCCRCCRCCVCRPGERGAVAGGQRRCDGCAERSQPGWCVDAGRLTRVHGTPPPAEGRWTRCGRGAERAGPGR